MPRGVFVSSVEVKSESSDSDEDLLLDDGYSCKIVGVFVPELARAHAHTLSFVLANNDLDQIFVANVFIELTHALLRLFRQLLHQLLNLMLARHVLQALINHSFDRSTGLLSSEQCVSIHRETLEVDILYAKILTAGRNLSFHAGSVWYVLLTCCAFPLFLLSLSAIALRKLLLTMEQASLKLLTLL